MGDATTSSSSLYITGCKDGKIRIFNVVDDDNNDNVHELVIIYLKFVVHDTVWSLNVMQTRQV